MLRILSFLPAVAAVCPLLAQEPVQLQAEGTAGTVVVRAFEHDSTQGAPLLLATWRMNDGGAPSFDLQRPIAPVDDAHLALDQLLLAGIEQYLDGRVHFAKEGVRTDVPVDRMVQEIEGMMGKAAAAFKGQAVGLSEPTRQQLTRVSRIDWSKARFGVDGGDDQDKYLAIYYYVRTQRQELERQLRADLLPLADIEVLAPSGGEVADPGRTVEVPTICRTVFDDQNYLCALDLSVGDTQLVLADAVLTDQLMMNLAAKAHTEVPAPKLRKRDRWLKAELDAINQRIDKLDQRKELWTLRDRIDGMEERIDHLDDEMGAMRAGRPEEGATVRQEKVIVRFTKGSIELDGEARAALAEVATSLARAPGARLLITGFTDRSGDPARNLALSEARAKAVRDHLLRTGLDPGRLLVNYYGDSKSAGEAPGERRVEIERLR